MRSSIFLFQMYLKSLDIGSNNLPFLDFSVVAQYPKLERLFVYSSNVYTILPPRRGQTFPRLDQVALQNNHLTTIPDLCAGVAMAAQFPVAIHLKNNDFHCDACAEWLLNCSSARLVVPNAADFKCASPANHYNSEVLSLSSADLEPAAECPDDYQNLSHAGNNIPTNAGCPLACD